MPSQSHFIPHNRREVFNPTPGPMAPQRCGWDVDPGGKTRADSDTLEEAFFRVTRHHLRFWIGPEDSGQSWDEKHSLVTRGNAVQYVKLNFALHLNSK